MKVRKSRQRQTKCKEERQKKEGRSEREGKEKHTKRKKEREREIKNVILINYLNFDLSNSFNLNAQVPVQSVNVIE